jgi:hypothetical protein
MIEPSPSTSPAPTPLTQASRTVRLRRFLILTTLAFFAGIGAMAWALTQWQGPRSLLGLSTPEGTDILSHLDEAKGEPSVKLPPMLDAPVMVPNPDRASGLIAVYAARRALDQGQPLGLLEGALTAQFGRLNARAVALVVAAGHNPVTTNTLRAEFDAIAPSLTRDPAQGLLDRARHTLSTLIIIRRAENAPSTPDHQIGVARRLVDQSKFAEAGRVIAAMPGAAIAKPWLASAARYLETRRALDSLEAAVPDSPLPAARPSAPFQ